MLKITTLLAVVLVGLFNIELSAYPQSTYGGTYSQGAYGQSSYQGSYSQGSYGQPTNNGAYGQSTNESAQGLTTTEAAAYGPSTSVTPYHYHHSTTGNTYNQSTNDGAYSQASGSGQSINEGAYSENIENETQNVQPTGPITGHGAFIFNPRTLVWEAYAPNGTLVMTGHGSGGSNYCRDIHRRCHTPVGHFFVYSKGDASCKSSKFPVDRPGAPMPWCMYFHSGFAIHGSYEVRDFNASHGCIRISPRDANWLSHNLITIGTLVIVKPY